MVECCNIREPFQHSIGADFMYNLENKIHVKYKYKLSLKDR